MKEKDLEKMKQLLEQKKVKQNDKQRLIPEKSIGAGQKGKSNIKAGGSNNKV